MNRSQKMLLRLAAAGLAVVLLFPPFDQYSIANFHVPVFAGFYFYLAPPQYGVVNTSMLLLEVSVVLINAAIGWLLLRDRPSSVALRRRNSYQNAVLMFTAINLVLIVLFPPFESVFALANAALPTFEGFYFLFTQRPSHTIVTALLYIEGIFILVNGALAWLIFKHIDASGITPEHAQALAMQLRRGKS